MPLAQMTKMRACERILEDAGIIRVLAWADADDGPPSSTNTEEILAFRVLDDAIREIHLKYDYLWSKRQRVTYTADGSGLIALPINLARSKRYDIEITMGEDEIVERDGYLYNVTDATTNFGAGATIVLDITTWPTYQELPASAREYARAKASVAFLRTLKGPDAVGLRDLRIAETAAQAQMEKDHGLRQQPPLRNILSGPSGFPVRRWMPPIGQSS